MYEPATDAEAVKAFAYDCCLHIAAFAPQYITQADVDPAYIAEQTDIFKSQVEQDEKSASKPQNVKDGIVQGKIKKHLASICFVDQPFVKDPSVTVAEFLKSHNSAAVNYVRYEVGEGMEKRNDDFAAEVAAQMNMGK